MRLPVAAWVTAALLREMLRALGFPLHLLLYWPRRRHWRALARAALEQPPGGGDDHQLDRFLARGRATRQPHVFLSAGEASGEVHAEKVLRSAQGAGLEARWSCFGGPLLARAGGDVLVPMSEHGIMGISGVLRALPLLLGAVGHFVRLLRDDPPDLVVLVDYPGMHLVLGRLARLHGVPVLHYIAPQYWAWAPWRLRRYRRCVDATLTILPFEPAFFAAVALPSAYVGHPLLDQPTAPPEPDADDSRETVCLLPGSRRGELESNLPAFVAIAANLRRDHPELRFVLPHTDERRRPLIERLLAEHGADFIEFRLGPLAPWLSAARVALAKSGTGSLEAVLHGTPTVVIYKMKGGVARFFHRHYLTVPWVASANLIAGRQVVPEHVFEDPAGWQRAEADLRRLLADGPERERCLAGVREVRDRLGAPGASDRVARWLLRFFQLPSVR